MSDFGARLRQAREARGISQRQIAAVTKISLVALEALERNDFSRLPGGIFSRAFVRAYAIEVGLDPEQTVGEFLVAYEKNHHAAAERAVPEVTEDDLLFLERQRRAARWLRGLSIALALALAALLIGWRMGSRGDAPAEAESVVEQSAAPAAVPPPPPAGPTRVPQPATTSGTPASRAGEHEVALHLRAMADCWVRATVDGTVVLEEIVKSGETRDLAPGREVYLQVGNAGALEWSINGAPAAPLGRPGQTASARVSRATVDRYLQ